MRHSLIARVVGLGAVAAFTLAACGSDSSTTSGASASTDVAATDTTCVDTIMNPCNTGGGDGDGDGDRGGRGDHGDFDPAAMQAAANAFTECLRGEGLDVTDLDMSQMPDDRDHDGPPPSDGSIPADGAMPPDGPRDGDPVTRLVNDLGLDTTDATVSAAVDACSSTLTSAFPPPPPGDNGNATTTTAG